MKERYIQQRLIPSAMEPRGVVVVPQPFGGTKDTGNGHREAGQAALDVFTEWKSVYVDYSGTLQRAQIDTN